MRGMNRSCDLPHDLLNRARRRRSNLNHKAGARRGLTSLRHDGKSFLTFLNLDVADHHVKLNGMKRNVTT